METKHIFKMQTIGQHRSIKTLVGLPVPIAVKIWLPKSALWIHTINEMQIIAMANI